MIFNWRPAIFFYIVYENLLMNSQYLFMDLNLHLYLELALLAEETGK